MIKNHMDNEMNTVNVARRGLWLNEEMYEKLCDAADEMNITPIEYIIFVLDKALDGEKEK